MTASASSISMAASSDECSDHCCIPTTAATGEVDSLCHLEEGKHEKIDIKGSATESNGAAGYGTQMEDVASLADNEARWEKERKSSSTVSADSGLITAAGRSDDNIASSQQEGHLASSDDFSKNQNSAAPPTNGRNQRYHSSITSLSLNSDEVLKTAAVEFEGDMAISDFFRTENENSSQTKSNRGGGRMRRYSERSITNSVGSEGNIKTIFSSISSIFNPISKRRQQELLKRNSSSLSSTTNGNNKSHGASNRININNKKQPQQQDYKRNPYGNNDSNSVKDPDTFVAAAAGGSSIFSPLKKKQSRVSWQSRKGGDDLERELFSGSGSGASDADCADDSKSNFFGSKNNHTKKSSSSKRGSSWTIADLEEILASDGFVVSSGGQIGSNNNPSAESILTPEEQQLWASMLQMASLYTDVTADMTSAAALNNESSEAFSSIRDNTKSNEKVLHGAVNQGAAAILHTNAVTGDNDGEKAISRPPGTDDDTVECETNLSRAMSSASPTGESSSNHFPPSSSLLASPPQSPLSTDITPATAIAVTTLAYQEVEDYRARLRRKREEMEGIDSQQQQQQCPNELSHLNELLLESATNINNAVLLQRALYALRIHRGSLAAVDNRVLDSSERTADPSSNDVNHHSSRSNSCLGSRSRSEHTGLDQLALNRLLSLTSSVGSSIRSSGTTDSVQVDAANTNQTWTTITAPSNNNNINENNSIQSSNPSSTLVRRRHTALGAPQVGAYHQNEPAPLLFRRTYAHPNRSERRQATRRATLDELHLARTSCTDSGNRDSGGQEQPPRRRRRTSFDSITSGASQSSNSDYWPNIDEESANLVEEFAMALQYSPTTNSPAGNSITARVTPYNADEGYNRSDRRGSASSVGSNNPHNILLTARTSIRNRSTRHRQMIQAVLVSDEIVEAAHVVPSDNEGAVFPNDLERMKMIEEMLEEKEEEARIMEEIYRRRERVWIVAVTLLIVTVIALTVAVVLTARIGGR